MEMMAEGKRYGFVPQLVLEKIFLEAQSRWLHPVEVCEILRNHKSLKISLEPLNRPTSGSLFLFDRRISRYFRKDGHVWRKKKDGKTVKEAHEKLKSGRVDVAHCYYAHGENNETFQRRSYWMLEKDFEHIALVHYLETKGLKSRLHRTKQLELPTYCPINSSSFASPSENINPNHFSSVNPTSLPSHMDMVGYNTFPQNFDSSIWSPQGTVAGDCVFANELALEDNIKKRRKNEPSLGDDIDSDSTIIDGVFANDPGLEDGIDLDNRISDGVFANESGLEDDLGALNGWQNLPDNFGLLQGDNIEDPGTVQPLEEDDSFSRWMSTELTGELDVDSSQIKSNSESLWNYVDVDGVLGNTRVSSHTHGVSSDAQLENFAVGPMISQDQLFSIVDYSPNWACANSSQWQVLVTGTFMKCEEEVKNYKWSCMFGEIEVLCDLLPGGTLRCYSPSLKPDRVPFYITVSNRLACREIREFEFQEPESQFLDTSFLNPNSDHSYRLDQFLCSARKKYPWTKNHTCNSKVIKKSSKNLNTKRT